MARSTLSSPALLLACMLGLGGQAEAQKAHVDRYELKVERPPTEVPLFLKEFSTENADLGTAKKGKKKAQDTAAIMKSVAPPALLQSMSSRLSQHGDFSSVSEFAPGSELPVDALLIEGEFTLLNPGSRGKRYWVGMGAGKSKICISGHVVNGSGQELATFEHCRSGAVGWFGGKADGMMATDVHQTGYRVADWMSAWANAQPPIRMMRK